MSQAVVASNRSYASEVPFHGKREGYAKLYSVLAVAFALLDMALPLLGLHRKPGLHVVRSLAVVVACLSVMTTYFSVYKRLGRRIALGGEDAVFLDRMRRDIAFMVFSLLSLGWILWSAGLFSR
jgi:hypothetical protein